MPRQNARAVVLLSSHTACLTMTEISPSGATTRPRRTTTLRMSQRAKPNMVYGGSTTSWFFFSSSTSSPSPRTISSTHCRISTPLR